MNTITISISRGTAFPDAAHRPSSRDLPSLDGLRAISIACVILGHATQGRVTPLLAIVLSRLSQFGVCVFFVISGYLITSLLRKEAELKGNVNLRRFYLRRTLRIFPPYYVFIAVIAIGVAANAWTMPPDARWWPALTYTSEIFPTRFWLLSHSWSLSIEEQFYLTWPLILSMTVRYRGLKSGLRLSHRIAFTSLLVFSVLRIVFYELTKNGILTEALIFDYVAAGSAVALFQRSARSARIRDASDMVLRSRVTPLAAVLALILHLIFASGMRWIFAVDVLVSIPLEAVLLAVFIAWAVENPLHIIGRILNLRILRVVGIGSYSVYLWQQLFLGVDSPFAQRWSFAPKLAALIACAAMSYFGIERPALRLRARIERRVFVA